MDLRRQALRFGDEQALTKNGWRTQIVRSNYPAPAYKVTATRDSWDIVFHYPDEGGQFAEGKLFRHIYGQAARAREVTRSQMRRLAGMSAEGLEANWGKVTI